MKWMRSAVAVALLASLAGCSYIDETIACTAIAVPALNVTVIDGGTSQRVCNATVTATEGTFSELLAPFGDATTCSYSGPYEREGLYEVRVTRVGSSPASVAGIRVTSDECHVITRNVTVTLGR